MPSDVVGTSLVVTTAQGGKDLAYRPGPIFANLVLADEINRATPKTQSALLEAMAERTVSVEGQPRRSAGAVLRPRDREPHRDGGRLPAARGAARSLPGEARRQDARPRDARAASAPAPRSRGRPRPSPSPEELLEVQAARAQRSRRRRTSSASPPGSCSRRTPRRACATAPGPRAVQALMACGRARALLDGRAAVAVDDVKAARRPPCSATASACASRPRRRASTPTRSSPRRIAATPVE